MSYVVSIDNTAESYSCRESQNLLAGMEALARKAIPVGCRGGGCGICKVRVQSGSVCIEKMSREVITAAEEASGLVLACRAYPRSNVRLAAVDRLSRCVERSYERSFFQRSLST